MPSETICVIFDKCPFQYKIDGHTLDDIVDCIFTNKEIRNAFYQNIFTDYQTTINRIINLDKHIINKYHVALEKFQELNPTYDSDVETLAGRYGSAEHSSLYLYEKDDKLPLDLRIALITYQREVIKNYELIQIIDHNTHRFKGQKEMRLTKGQLKKLVKNQLAKGFIEVITK